MWGHPVAEVAESGLWSERQAIEDIEDSGMRVKELI